MPWLVAGGGLTVVLVVALVLVFTGGERSSPERVAQDAVDAFNDKKPGDIRAFACADAPPRSEWTVDLSGSVAEVRGVTMDGEHRATADVRFNDPAGDIYVDVRMGLTEKHDEWCVSSFDAWSS